MTIEQIREMVKGPEYEFLRTNPHLNGRIIFLTLGGKDILSMGVPEGVRVGEILNTLLEEVISGSLPNDHDILAERARAML